jgi:hypothetical protein
VSCLYNEIEGLAILYQEMSRVQPYLLRDKIELNAIKEALA